MVLHMYALGAAGKGRQGPRLAYGAVASTQVDRGMTTFCHTCRWGDYIGLLCAPTTFPRVKSGTFHGCDTPERGGSFSENFLGGLTCAFTRGEG